MNQKEKNIDDNNNNIINNINLNMTDEEIQKKIYFYQNYLLYYLLKFQNYFYHLFPYKNLMLKKIIKTGIYFLLQYHYY